MSDLVGNPEDRFSHNKAHFKLSSGEKPDLNIYKQQKMQFSFTFAEADGRRNKVRI